MRGSDRSMRRDIDDIALSNHLSGSRHFSTPNVQQPLTGYGRKDMDDMVKIVFVKSEENYDDIWTKNVKSEILRSILRSS